ncbi:rskn-1, partial [Symbiodinium microadriaticum]
FMAQLREPGEPGTFARACIMLLMWLICHCHSDEDEASTAEAPASCDVLPGAQSEGVHGFAFVRNGLFMSALKDPARAPRACQQIFSLLRDSGPWPRIFEAMRPFEEEMTGQLLTQAFGILDHDGKGFVTLPDMQDVFGGGGWDVAEMLHEVTGPGDEAMTYSQFRKHMCVEDDEAVV